MKAIQLHELGEPDVLAIHEVPIPEPAPGEVLIKVHAAGVNPPDLYVRRGFVNIPREIRPQVQLPHTPGTDVSGVVVASRSAEWREGDEVFGLLRFPPTGQKGRAYAEYTTAPAADLARKPAGIDHVRAAAVPMSALTAYQYLFDHVRPAADQTVLVNGAAGGVGHFAVQLAKHLGASVIAVASGRHEQFLAGLGADRFVDYTSQDVATAVKDVDLLIDTVGGPHAHRLLPVVRPGGRIGAVFPGDYRGSRSSWRRCTRTGRSWASWPI
ncbi:NADP-dependent oxidoreductase [Nonomuraea terrae]|uniref:NADP-dependent oxidoreductase n=1 Tax=Nonomuraea terrae TaxID=2530383 RepID=UPI001CB74A73|nr:NADP-dependent oxidoreductase [Nonomuraea terrae]